MNKLSKETSPYLLQHAENPVDWYPWGEGALALAKSQNKPILLSIGYSACHWCHVMAHESFEDDETAALMNQHFINIKVDREERPDLDKLYQSAHQLLTQRSGGWPLTMFLMPDDQMPFFGGTYFPDKPRFQMPSFKQLLFQVAGLFNDRKSDIQQQSQSLSDALKRIYQVKNKTVTLTSAPLDQARMDLQQQFDSEQGGFGIAPKFPHTPFIERLLRHALLTTTQDTADKNALSIALFTLEKMARGGVNDQLGGGFCRYSTDNDWMIPHFEKMLYDNGTLLAEYVHAYAQSSAIKPSPLFERVCHETAQWVMREMQSDVTEGQGGYYSSFDADSKDKNGEMHEGLFYVWQPKEVRQLLTVEEYTVFSRRFGLDKNANFEGDWHLHIYVTMQALAEEFNQTEQALSSLINSARKKLQITRSKRILPDRDEKILTSWNGLMIRGMALSARYLNNLEYATSATQAVDFIRNTLWLKKQGRLLATYKADDKTMGKAHLNAYLDDYAFLLDALLELLQVRWRAIDLDFAIQIADTLLEQFEDKENGGFWFVSHDHESLIQRPKTYADDAIPNGNGVAVFALARLGYLLGETKYLDASERALKNASTGINQAPTAHCTLLKGLDEYLNPPQTVIIRGDKKALDDLKWSKQSLYSLRRQCYFIPNDEPHLPDGLKDKKPADKIVAYCCEGMTCQQPILGDESIIREL